MTQDMFPIDERGRTFNAEGVEVKLSPAMQSLVRALNAHGYIDPIRDFGRIGFGGSGRVGISTVVALMDRGILRESRTSRGVHFPATTPAQVEHEAYDENDRRGGELAAHVECPEQWYATVNEFSGAETHIRLSRSGYPIEIEQAGHRFWYVRINGRTPMSAGGTWQEARAAADRYERNKAHADAIDEDESRSIAMGKGQGWGQPDGMLSASTEPVWTPTVGDTVLHGRDDTTAPRPFGRVLLVDGLKVKVEWPGGVGWHWAHELEHHPMPSDRLARAEIAESEAHTALVRAAVDGGSSNAEIAQAYADHDRAADELRATHELEHHPMPSDASVRAEIEGQANAAAIDSMARKMAARVMERRRNVKTVTINYGKIRAIMSGGDGERDALLQADLRAGRADGKALPIVPNTPAEARTVTAGKIAELLAPADSGVPAAIGVAIMDLLRGNTPAEGRTGVSDRAAAALAEMRELVSTMAAPDGVAYAARNRAMAALDRIEAALRGGR